jgi:5-bromo-4-chloroindolyl phosphate hydrolysis protein
MKLVKEEDPQKMCRVTGAMENLRRIYAYLSREPKKIEMEE